MKQAKESKIQNEEFSSGKGILITSTERNRHKLLPHYILAGVISPLVVNQRHLLPSSSIYDPREKLLI